MLILEFRSTISFQTSRDEQRSVPQTRLNTPHPHPTAGTCSVFVHATQIDRQRLLLSREDPSFRWTRVQFLLTRVFFIDTTHTSLAARTQNNKKKMMMNNLTWVVCHYGQS